MAQQKVKASQQAGVPDSSEIRASFDGQAMHSDRFMVTTHSSGVRIGFLEKDPTAALPRFRTAVLLSYQDAIELSALLRTMLVEVEKQLEKAKTLSAN